GEAHLADRVRKAVLRLQAAAVDDAHAARRAAGADGAGAAVDGEPAEAALAGQPVAALLGRVAVRSDGQARLRPAHTVLADPGAALAAGGAGRPVDGAGRQGAEPV